MYCYNFNKYKEEGKHDTKWDLATPPLSHTQAKCDTGADWSEREWEKEKGMGEFALAHSGLGSQTLAIAVLHIPRHKI